MNAGGDSSSSLPNGRPTTIPISRPPPNPGVERPERARTSHACEPCRERKTKCDGERPSCRRCMHTGSTCHYGFGKGWRKRKVTEDLNASSRRLDRYEDLFNEILPMVNPHVRTMIERARDDDHPTSPVSDTADSEHQSSGSQPSDRSRLPPLPLPVPSPILSPAGRVGSHVFDPHSSSSSSSTNNNPIRHSFSRPSDDPAGGDINRLPSIRPDGMLIDPTPPYRTSVYSTEPPPRSNHRVGFFDEPRDAGGDEMSP